jgi:methylglutaconyl-CoA hydratase
MADYRTITLHVDARGVATCTLARPEKRNALSPEMMDELTDLAARMTAAPDVRAVVLAGSGGTFCAGGDLGWMRTQIAADRAGRIREARRLAGMLGALDAMGRPLIGRIEGAALGGGVGLASVCDVAVAAEDAVFGLTETRLGIIPATIAPYVVARIGAGRVRRVFMSGRVFGAAEAVDLGLVARAVPAAGLDAAVEAEVAPYLKVAPGAVAAAKALARSLGPRIDDAVVEATIERLADVWETEEASHGIAAFLEKRPPRWA